MSGFCELPFEECSDFVASISYGKDSLAMLEVIRNLGLPLTRIVTVDVMATRSMSANFENVETFKKVADKIIFERYGLVVEHLKATLSYEEQFYAIRGSRAKPCNVGKIYGFPMIRGAWCNSLLKMLPIEKYRKTGQWWYIGYAIDEKKKDRQIKIEQCSDLRKYPLVLARKTETDCMNLCSSLNLLSPAYEDGSFRDGCWFCHNQSLDQLRKLRKQYPVYWGKMLEWDSVSPVRFKPCYTLHELEVRFALEDEYLQKGQSIKNKSFFNAFYKLIKESRDGVALLDNGDTLGVTHETF